MFNSDFPNSQSRNGTKRPADPRADSRRLKNMAGWQFRINRGGMFTDIVALRPDGDAGAKSPARVDLLQSCENPWSAGKFIPKIASRPARPERKRAMAGGLRRRSFQ
jgi:hypothetical protein